MPFGHPLDERAKLFVDNKKDSFLLCDYIVSVNLPKWLKRQKAILFEFNQKIQDSNYDLFSSEQSKILFPQDKLIVTRLIFGYESSQDKKKFIEDVNNIFNLLQARINYFIKNYIDTVVIPVSQIDFNLKSCLFTWLSPNDSDAQTLASAVQEHNNNRLTIITADKKHWTDDLLKEVHNDSTLLKKYPFLPKIEYLQNYKP